MSSGRRGCARFCHPTSVAKDLSGHLFPSLRLVNAPFTLYKNKVKLIIVIVLGADKIQVFTGKIIKLFGKNLDFN